jgi:hypothetical protein
MENEEAHLNFPLSIFRLPPVCFGGFDGCGEELLKFAAVREKRFGLFFGDVFAVAQ